MALRRLFLVFALCLSGQASAGTPWEAYLETPSAANARHVGAIAYAYGVESRWEEDIDILQDQVIAGDRAAVGLAFRALCSADGDLAETLCAIIGRSIRSHPALFLQALRVNSASLPLLPSLLGNLGEAYVDRPEAQAYERAARREALLSVKDPSLRSLRDQAVSALLK